MLFDLNTAPKQEQVVPVTACRVTTGVGKTRILIEVIADIIKSGKTDNPWVYFVPTIRLGDEIVQLFAQHGVRAAVWRGRERPIVPSEPDRTMCINLNPVKLAVKAGLPVAEHCCESKKRGKTKRCPYFSVCAYQKQKNAKPDVWVAAHEGMFNDNESFGEPVGVVVDESFWQDGLFMPRWGIPIAAIRSSVLPPQGKEETGADLDALRNLLADVLDAQGNGPLETKNVVGKLSLRECTEAIKLEWELLPKTALEPGMSKYELKKFREQLPRIQFSRHMIAVWKAIRGMLDRVDIDVSGHVYIEDAQVKIRGIKTIRERWQVPTMIIDATLPDIAILRAFYPQAEIVGDWQTAMPHVQTRQVVNAPVSRKRLLTTKTDRNRKAIRRHIIKRYIETGRQKTLIVCQKEYEPWLAGCGLPDNVHIEHFNAIAGLDQYKDVRLLISIGRTLPEPEKVENMAAALTGKEPERVRGHGDDLGLRWYAPEMRGARMPDGTGRAVQCDVHPDPLCEAIRWQICEAEVVQAIGRARGVNRTADDPVDIDILANFVLPDELAELKNWREPSTLYEAALEGVVLTSPVDMVRAYPDVWPNETGGRPGAAGRERRYTLL